MVIQLESSTNCNARCIFCPRYEMTRPMGTMNDDLFYKIIKEGKELRIKDFYPFLNGEPFVFPKIWEWLDYMEKEGVRVSLYTNAELMDVDRLIEYKNINYVNCSLNATTEETYNKIMRGPNFNKVIENIKKLVDKARFRVNVSMVETKENTHEVEEFKKLWKKTTIVKYLNWGGARPVEFDGKKKPCCNLLNNINILWDGRVCLCCMDYNGQVILGDISKEPLKDILERKKLLEDRHKKLDFNMPLCENCNRNI